MKRGNALDRILSDQNRSFRERNFILMTIIAMTSVFLALLGDIITGENAVESIGLGSMLTVGVVAATLCVHYKKIDVGSIIIAMGVVFVAVPVAFFFGGGLTGGGVLWIVFSYLYIGLILEGRPRNFFLVMMTVLTIAEFVISYKMPNIITYHPRKMWHIDVGISVVLVGLMVFNFVRFESILYTLEAERSKKQAKEIEDLNRAQNRFFSSMSHEIRTPINTIIGLNEMILRENASDEINENAANIQAASKMLLHIINDILDMSKFESGEMTLSPVNYHTGDMLSDVVSMLWIKAKEKGLEFSVDVSPELPVELYGDELRIKQILINVLNNAIKYTGEGSVRLQIQCERGQDNGINVIYSISDTGMGIKKENIPYLFSAFKRADEDKNRYIEGTGLGLSIVKQFVDLMGGTITVNSVYTKGSTFVIEIPQTIVNDEHVGEIDMEKHRRRKFEEHVTAFEAPEAKVLVVDDTAANLLVVKKLLRDTKVLLDTASSGKEALQMTFETDYDVVFMDHIMPEMDGIECMHRIRNQNGGRSREAKMVALTANAGSDVEIMYAKEGFDGYVLKPVTGDDLENELYRQLPKDLVVVKGTVEKLAKESVAWIREHQKRAPIRVTSESVADIPPALREKYGIGIIDHMVRTPDGVFSDGLEIETNGLLAYMDEEDVVVETGAPGVSDHELFFADQFEKAKNIIHISISSQVKNSGCPAARDAALNFDNVYVVDSAHLSGGQGLMVIEAARMAAEGKQIGEILERLEKMKEHVHTTFVVDSIKYLVRTGQVGSGISVLTSAFMIHPVITLKKGRMKMGGIHFGSRERAFERYIADAFKVRGRIDKRLLFIVHVGLTEEELSQIEKEVLRRVAFEEIYIEKASPAIAVNCGPGTFGLLFATEF